MASSWKFWVPGDCCFILKSELNIMLYVESLKVSVNRLIGNWCMGMFSTIIWSGIQILVLYSVTIRAKKFRLIWKVRMAAMKTLGASFIAVLWHKEVHFLGWCICAGHMLTCRNGHEFTCGFVYWCLFLPIIFTFMFSSSHDVETTIALIRPGFKLKLPDFSQQIFIFLLFIALI